ncbi:PbsX family transcriptional regulator [Variovorax paradoxus]|uniref:PbsX family transcriptional regulator n=2 Tax=Variovorax paradoxus TaxID=34073 RepID=A0A0D0L1L4_VARPD|nr:penicillin acylase family protein [Variovorax paradoxus]KIQ22918.1 PbsX family transcriptional regulator [Variovorax paradoxus]
MKRTSPRLAARRMPSHRLSTGALSAIALAAIALAGCASGPPGGSNTTPTRPASSFAVPGLEKPAEVLVDRWGVPHLYAGTLYDAFVAQGFIAARDRLWQMDLWRKRGLGEMAKDFGPAWVESDRAARAVLYRGDMYREWLAYGSDAKRVAEAFTAGVNAYVAQVRAQPALLPTEFALLGYQPATWSPEDVVRIRHHGLTLNFTSEVDRARAFCAGGPGIKADWLRRELDPPVTPKVPVGFDPCTIPAAELRAAYMRATESPQFTKANTRVGMDAGAPSTPVALLPGSAESIAAKAVQDAAQQQALQGDPTGAYGSNNWVISPKLTSTGRPILANDPHRSHGAPSLRYMTHLSAPGMDAIGAGEPFLPGLSIGHNGTIAFGLTRFYMDQEDLYVYQLNPRNPNEYRYQGRWEPMTRVTERIAVKGEGAPREVVNTFTRHGPVLLSEPGKRRAYALRAAWLEPGMAPYFGSMDYMRARNWDQFRAAMNRWGAPGENQVYADSSGNVGWIPGGLTPIRPNWDGLMPVPGDGRYEWSGFRNGDELPSEFNPARGYVVTANENNIPPDHPAAKKGIGYEWSDAARARRLKELFAAKVAAGSRFTIEDSERMQNDIVATPAQRLLKLLAGLRSDDAQTAAGLRLLQGWDGTMDRDSAAAALYEVWSSKPLRAAVLKAGAGDVGAPLAAPGDNTRMVLLLENPFGWITDAQRDALLLQTLPAAMQELTAKLGPDMKAWKWGTLHRAEFRHPLAGVVDAATRKKLDVGDWPMSGSSFTPMAATYRASDYKLTSGASFRMVLDVGNWDASRVINTPGQSGNPDSPNYRDLAPLWLEGKYVPLVYSRGAVEKETVERIQLTPAK